MRKHVMHTAEYKADAVKLSQSGERTMAEVARDLGVPYWTIRDWCKKASVTKKPKATRIAAVAGETPEQRFNRLEKEVGRLRKENESLRTDREILKKAAAFFAKESG